MMKVYITLMGKSTHALVNSFWAASKIHGYYPDKIYIIRENRDDTSRNEVIKENLKFIMSEFNYSAEIIYVDIDSFDFQGCIDKINEIFNLHEKAEITIDITSGRKYMAVAAVLSGWERAEHIFFLQSEMIKYREMPFMMRPMVYQHPVDLKNFESTRGRVWQI